MNRRVLLLLSVALGVAGFRNVAVAATEAGDYEFQWDSENSNWFTWANGDTIDSYYPPDAWVAYSSAGSPSGTLTYDLDYVNTTYGTGFLIQTGRFSYTSINVQFVVDDVTGTLNYSGHSGAWTITMHLVFSASGVITGSSCTSSQFTFTFSGDYEASGSSSTFTVPSLSGTGTQACNGYASTINSDLDLGTSGAQFDFGKFSVSPITI